MAVDSLKVTTSGQFGWISTDADHQQVEHSIAHFPGLPNLPVPIPGATEFLTRFGPTFQPQYPGTYDSEGDFDPINIVADLKVWWDDTSDWQMEAEIKKDLPKADCIFSLHSFGAFVGLRMLEAHSWLLPKAIIMFAPTYAFGGPAKAQGIRNDLEAKALHMAQFYPRTFRQDDPERLNALFTRGHEFDFSNRQAVQTPVYVVLGKKDPSLDAVKALEFTQDFFSKHTDVFDFRGEFIAMEAGHSMASLLSDDSVSEALTEVLNSI